MQGTFDSNLEKYGIRRGTSVLLAVSGGMDSMCMANLCRYSMVGAKYEIAHMNFSLRGEESDADEALVRSFASDWGIRCHVRKVDTLAYVSENGKSVEMAARELRYSWFAKLCDEFGFEHVFIAHNANDSAETLFLNLIRGTGLRGLSGIRPSNGRILRPLLGFSRRKIAEYAELNKVPYRDDRTNFETDYSRNKIRNVIFPEISKINPSFLKTLLRDMSYFNEASDILDDLYESKKAGFMSAPDGERLCFELKIDALAADRFCSYWLYRLLSEFSFNAAQVSKIENAMRSQSGKEFYSKTHYLVKDRNVFRIYPLQPSSEAHAEIVEVSSLPYAFENCGMKISVLSSPEQYAPGADLRSLPRCVHVVSSEKLSFPLFIRSVRPGDRFRPLGMRGFKKVSDFLTDIKADRFEKENAKVLVCRKILPESGAMREEIVALLGYRIDDRFKY